MRAALRHLPAAVAVTAALGLGVVAIRQGTWAVGGSDSACYGLMAKTLASGTLQPASGLALRAPWPDAATTFAPAGFVPSPVREGAASPVCAPGFSLLLVPFVWLGGLNGIFWGTPVASVLLVWLGFVLGRRLAGDWAGVLAAVLVATSPIVLYQAVQPMNDVTTAMLWLAVVVAASRSSGRYPKNPVSTTEDTEASDQWSVVSGQEKLITGHRPLATAVWAAGALTGLALLVRPNLLPVGVLVGIAVPVLYLRQTKRVRLGPDTTAGSSQLLKNSDFTTKDTKDTKKVSLDSFVTFVTFVVKSLLQHPARLSWFPVWLTAALKFAVGALPGLLVIAWLNAKLYGSALRSGYGDLEPLFGLSFVPTNLARYSRWLIETHTALPFAALAAPFVCARDRRGPIALALVIAGATTAVYLAYHPFEDWSYLRFLLPALVLALVLAAAAVAALADRVHRNGAAICCCVLAVLFGPLNLRTANRQLAFSLDVLERRFRDTGMLVRDRLPANAALFAVWQSGTVRFYSGKETILWDSLDPSQLDLAISWLRQAGYRPYILVERTEETPFRQRFEGVSQAGPLDWPPIFDIDRQARIFDPADRARYLKGEGVRTEYVEGGRN